MESWREELYHHGIKGQKWGDRNGPPYPLNNSQKSKAEKKVLKSLQKTYKKHTHLDPDEAINSNKYLKQISDDLKDSRDAIKESTKIFNEYKQLDKEQKDRYDEIAANVSFDADHVYGYDRKRYVWGYKYDDLHDPSDQISGFGAYLFESNQQNAYQQERKKTEKLQKDYLTKCEEATMTLLGNMKDEKIKDKYGHLIPAKRLVDITFSEDEFKTNLGFYDTNENVASQEYNNLYEKYCKEIQKAKVHF